MESKKFFTKVVKGQDFEPKYVNGAFGNFNLQGELMINFFMDFISLPESSEIDIEINSNASTSERFKESGEIERKIQASLLLNETTVRNVYEWLKEKIDLIDKQKEIGKE